LCLNDFRHYEAEGIDQIGYHRISGIFPILCKLDAIFSGDVLDGIALQKVCKLDAIFSGDVLDGIPLQKVYSLRKK